MNKEQFHQLLDKYLAGKTTPEEELYIINYCDSFQEDERNDVQLASLKSDVELKMLNRIQMRLAHQKFRKSGSLMPTFMRTAAILLVFFAAGLLFYNIHIGSPESTKKGHHQKVVPGGNKATLTLADGTIIYLKDAAKGFLSADGNALISKTSEGEIVYKPGLAAGPRSSISSLNTLSTPEGGQFKVILEDGSVVWLNAGSSISFPSTFQTNERVVDLDGEAYFEVARNPKRPFKVRFKGKEITVLGTRFNVSAYADDEQNITTLLEGSISISQREKQLFLKPGEQVLTKHDELTKVTGADTEEAIAWKNGLFMFSNEKIGSVMRKIARWYDVEVEFRGDISQKAVWGTISKFEEVSEVLKMLELTGVVQFQIEGRRITVMP